MKSMKSIKSMKSMRSGANWSGWIGRSKRKQTKFWTKTCQKSCCCYILVLILRFFFVSLYWYSLVGLVRPNTEELRETFKNPNHGFVP